MVNSNCRGHPVGVGVLASATAFTVSKNPFQFPVRRSGGFFGDGERVDGQGRAHEKSESFLARAEVGLAEESEVFLGLSVTVVFFILCLNEVAVKFLSKMVLILLFK